MIFGYDILTYNGPIPNCLPNEMLNTIKEASNYNFEMSGEYFQKKHQTCWPLFNSNFFDYGNDFEVKSIYQIKRERLTKKNYQKWFYLIEPFASLEQFFGNTEHFNTFLIENIPTETLQEIRDGNGNILINYIIDGGYGITKQNFLKLKNYLIDNKIPDEKIYLIFQDFKLGDNLKSLETNYNFLNFNMALLSKSQEFYNIINNPEYKYWGEDANEPQVGRIQSKKSSIHTIDIFKNNLNKSDKLETKKNFLFFCRHVRLERLIILDFLYKNGEEKNLFSWSKDFMNECKDTVENFEKFTNNKELTFKFLNEDRVLDVDDITKIAGYGFEDKSLYENSFLSIVGETIFYQNEEFKTGYLSEKVWKPIGHSHPFIILAPSKTLNYLKELGFKTFSPFIDESYDDIEDENLRLKKILEILENFSNKTLDEKYQFLFDVKDILEHNFNLFISISQNQNNYRTKYIQFLGNNKLI